MQCSHLRLGHINVILFQIFFVIKKYRVLVGISSVSTPYKNSEFSKVVAVLVWGLGLAKILFFEGFVYTTVYFRGGTAASFSPLCAKLVFLRQITPGAP